MARRARKHGAMALGLALVALVGCSLVVDTSDINEGCGENYKPCQGRCVSITDPAFGCEPKICLPCKVENAIPECRAGACAVKECLLGFDCRECPTNLFTDEKNCGACHNECSAEQICANGNCITTR